MERVVVPDRGRTHGPWPETRWARARPVVRQLLRYALVGGTSTALTAGLFLVLRPFLHAVPANLIALTVTTALSTEVNRAFAFGGARAHRLRGWVQDFGTVAFYACYGSVVLLAVQAVSPGAPPSVEALAVALASIGGGIARFLVLRHWVFDTRAADSDPCSRTSHRST